MKYIIFGIFIFLCLAQTIIIVAEKKDTTDRCMAIGFFIFILVGALATLFKY